MTRIIAGVAGGRRIATPSGSGTRPTSDRVREAIFSRLEHEDLLEGARVLDLYAGSGALGLEACSRGAAEALLVESSRAAAQIISGNIRDLGLRQARVVTRPVATLLGAGPSGGAGTGFDVVLSDPPYDLGDGALHADLVALVDHGWLAPAAVVVVERSSRSGEPRWPNGLEQVAHKRYGETSVWYAEVTDSAGATDCAEATDTVEP
ncbi:16S rRNA (guanine(966)-N(2))-methyltransferase RsmD [Arsenicicoccus piscis]|uniref:16S rRNA (guanine(966)-N(2))-methyltransferase RsmD n=1 Tax=Arsenicicoccus piscis TaxID=673954 RepID=UPI001F4C6F35|nr:16S rRNA (guanine(966)-N(2))-methyltransferase RsmD [Arsenicicoccus piscis]MCH8626896.1 16S rRNA (guanine(966)-N(2))-methyltransferase RsmD [Arsenicicoccus piscis]